MFARIRSLRFWVPAAIALAGVLLYLTSHVLDERAIENLTRQRSVTNMRELLRASSLLVESLVTSGDEAAGLRVVQFIRSSALIRDAYVADAQGRPLAFGTADSGRVAAARPLRAASVDVGRLLALPHPDSLRTLLLDDRRVLMASPLRWPSTSGAPVYLVCEASYALGLQAAERLLRFKAAVTMVLGLVLMVLLAWVLHRRVTGPARSIAEAASRLAAGERSARTGLRGPDELGQAGQAFDAMADAITRTEAELKELRNQLQTVLQNMPVGVMAVDRTQRRVLYSNRAFEELYGVPLHVGRSMDSILPDVRLEKPDGTPYPLDELSIRRVARTGEPAEAGDLVYVHGDGTRVPVLVRSVPVRREGEDDFDTVLVIAQDRRELESALAERRETQRLFDAVLRALPVGVVVLSRDLQLLYANPKWCEIHGERLDTGANMMEAAGYTQTYADGTPYPPDLLAAPQVLRTGQPAEVRDIVEVRPDGTRVPILINAAPVSLSGSGEMDAVVSVVQDRRELQRLTHELREWERRYEKVVAAMSQVVYEWDLRTDIEVVSANRSIVIGDPTPGPAVPILERWTRRLHPDDRERARAALEKSLRDGSPYDCEYRYQHSDTRYVVVHDRGFFDLDEHGVPVRMYGTMTDVTERHTLEQQLRQAQKMETVGTLAGGVAHDFNNQLTAVLGHLDLLAADLPPDDPGQQHVRVARLAAERCTQLTRGLLAFSRQIESRLRPLELDPLVEETLQILRRVLPASVAVRTELGTDGTAAMLDAVQLQQVLFNLCVNARDAMPDGGTLAITTCRRAVNDLAGRPPEARSGEFVELTVSDTGVGIPGHLQSRVFEPFFTTKPVGEGTGLGLAMAYGIVRKHLGWIELESAPGHGATFRVYLPVATEAAQQAADPPAPEVRARSGQAHVVLVVDDEPGIRELASLALLQYGYQVRTAADGSEALRCFRAEPDAIRLVLLDLVMPGLSATAVLREIRALRPDVRVVLSTGYAPADGVPELPVDAMLPKPYSASDLAHTVDSLLESPPTEPAAA